jgi:hypothetical protein
LASALLLLRVVFSLLLSSFPSSSSSPNSHLLYSRTIYFHILLLLPYTIVIYQISVHHTHPLSSHSKTNSI